MDGVLDNQIFLILVITDDIFRLSLIYVWLDLPLKIVHNYEGQQPLEIYSSLSFIMDRTKF